MLSGSAILRISLLLVVAGCLAALVQYLLPHAPPTADVRSSVLATVAPPPRRVGTATPPSVVPLRDPVASPAPSPLPAPQPRPAEQASASAPPFSEVAPVAPAPQVPQPSGQAEVDEADSTAGPRALALVDLNTASVPELNGLGGGSIGRAIVQRRPYTAIDQLLSKRVLSRATYDKIKDQITVR